VLFVSEITKEGLKIMIIVEKYPEDTIIQILENGTGVRVIHLSTCLTATCDIYKSISKNKLKASKAIQSTILEGLTLI